MNNSQEISKLLDYAIELLNRLTVTGVQNAMLLSASVNALTEIHKKLPENPQPAAEA